ncbi:hypothetical protein [Methylobacterium sp. WL9]|uniref:hypothetical protein n=1 Tax=Methylobacterium sp. WL9 TaxID=2603898 RepID=UPI0011CC3706|nr:hypothetical protein [Methylobacterium sp. WL9]TXN21142.1 hypothetical protein FV217_15450 [Methylobacterium sp. WL9]
MDPMAKAWADRFERLAPDNPRFAQDVRALLDRLKNAIGHRGDFVLALDDIACRLERRDRSGTATLLALIHERQRPGPPGHVSLDTSHNRAPPAPSMTR